MSSKDAFRDQQGEQCGMEPFTHRMWPALTVLQLMPWTLKAALLVLGT